MGPLLLCGEYQPVAEVLNIGGFQIWIWDSQKGMEGGSYQRFWRSTRRRRGLRRVGDDELFDDFAILNQLNAIADLADHRARIAAHERIAA